MNLTIKPLTPELATDFFDFFDNRAFTDNSPYRCYCQVYQMSKKQQKDAAEEAIEKGLDGGEISRLIAKRQIKTGALKGYLAFVDDLAIGWCNANDRANFPIEPCTDTPFYAPAEKHEKAVVCFEIAPEHRRKGVATALLTRVCEDAKIEGYTAVLGFPVVKEQRFEWDSPGPLRLFEKCGFIKDGCIGKTLIMRRDLNNEIRI